MAKVVIVIEDQDGRVKTVSTPSFAYMASKLKHGEMTSAEGYAICALNAIREASKKMKQNSGKLIVPLPRISLN